MDGFDFVKLDFFLLVCRGSSQFCRIALYYTFSDCLGKYGVDKVVMFPDCLRGKTFARTFVLPLLGQFEIEPIQVFRSNIGQFQEPDFSVDTLQKLFVPENRSVLSIPAPQGDIIFRLSRKGSFLRRDKSGLTLVLEFRLCFFQFFFDCPGVFHALRYFPCHAIRFQLFPLGVPATVDPDLIGINNTVFVFQWA